MRLLPESSEPIVAVFLVACIFDAYSTYLLIPRGLVELNPVGGLIIGSFPGVSSLIVMSFFPVFFLAPVLWLWHRGLEDVGRYSIGGVALGKYIAALSNFLLFEGYLLHQVFLIPLTAFTMVGFIGYGVVSDWDAIKEI